MFNKSTEKLLINLLPNLPVIVGESSLRHDIDDLLSITMPKMRCAVIDDNNTSIAFGDKIFAVVKDFPESVHLTLKDGIEADLETVEYIRKKTSKCDALIAVGSGTINDLCKYASFLDGKPYVVFPTAASMNGYLSANASISKNGYKTTFPAKLPIGVFCDYSVLANAPVRLSKSGLGDSLARPTAQADWLLSHIVLDTAYDESPFLILADTEDELFDNAEAIAKNDPEIIIKLIELLLLSGLGMTIAGGSYPASQGEHMIAHSYNMLKKSQKKLQPLHGEEITITSLYMAKYQQKILDDCPNLIGRKFNFNHMAELFGNDLAKEFFAEFNKKQELIDEFIKNNQIINWDHIQEKLEKILVKPKQMMDIINKAELPASFDNLGWNAADFELASNNACFTRNRFTFLDL